jgi:hypothetical protein
MRVAIFTHPSDSHAHAVKWGLKERGWECDLVFLGDLSQKAVITVDPTVPAGARIGGEGYSRVLASYDRFWLRKPHYPVIPSDLHPSDRTVARLSWEFTTDAMLRSLGKSGVFCINPPAGSETSPLKAYHLTLAHSVGLTIPKTMITNCGTAARAFIASNRADGANTIAKGMELSVWNFEAGGFAVFGTTRVTEEEVADASLKLAPCIFQAEVPKSAEARVTVMGRTTFPARLDSQNITEAELDFRLAPDWNHLGCTPIEMPGAVREQVLAFQAAAGLNFGTMDFIIDRDGNWIFVETNPLGQFLWVEDAHPETTLLDAFVDFVISGTNDFVYDTSKQTRLHMKAYLDSLSDEDKRELATEKDRHVEITYTGALDRPLGA